MAYRIEPQDGIVRIVFSGTFTNDDLSLGAIEMAEMESSSKVVPHRIADLRPVERLEIDFVGVLALAEARRRRRYKNSFKTAILAPDVEHFGFARMFQTLNDHPQIVIAIFEGDGDARQWLRLPDLKAPARSWEPQLHWAAG